MRITICVYIVCVCIFFAGCRQNQHPDVVETSTIAQGQMPNLVKDSSDNLHLVYGSGDSILYKTSKDGGKTFSTAVLIDTMPGLYDFAMRGPQVACTNNGVTIIAANKPGDIYAYQKTYGGAWSKTGRVNDVDTIAKEGLMALAGEGNTLFAAWLDLRGNNRNKIVGARSIDGGKTWDKNILVYASPDSSVCECCKPSVAVRRNTVYVMFRNWLHGNRDLYVSKSQDAGNTFAQAQKTGTGNWPLNGCPMDGGAIAMNANDVLQTVWRRQDTIFAWEPGQPEIMLGRGKGCTMATANNKNVYAWAEKDEIVCLLPYGKKQTLGKGMLPILKALANNKFACVWEDEKQVKLALVDYNYY